MRVRPVFWWAMAWMAVTGCDEKPSIDEGGDGTSETVPSDTDTDTDTDTAEPGSGGASDAGASAGADDGSDPEDPLADGTDRGAGGRLRRLGRRQRRDGGGDEAARMAAQATAMTVYDDSGTDGSGLTGGSSGLVERQRFFWRLIWRLVEWQRIIWWW